MGAMARMVFSEFLFPFDAVSLRLIPQNDCIRFYLSAIKTDTR